MEVQGWWLVLVSLACVHCQGQGQGQGQGNQPLLGPARGLIQSKLLPGRGGGPKIKPPSFQVHKQDRQSQPFREPPPRRAEERRADPPAPPPPPPQSPPPPFSPLPFAYDEYDEDYEADEPAEKRQEPLFTPPDGPPRRPFRPDIQEIADYEHERRRVPNQPGPGGKGKDKEEEEEEDKPDRLTLLLQKTRFDCVQKKNGYYADEGLECEVFHYCADGVRSSWMCPMGAKFHQVHLICMPDGTEDVCKDSSKFHFVNEYLYKPINENQARTHNESLIYADRYYPKGYAPGTHVSISELAARESSKGGGRPPPRASGSHPDYEYDYKDEEYTEDLPAFADPKQGSRPPPRPVSPQGSQNAFFSSDDVSVPLSQRRPPPSNFRPRPAASSIVEDFGRRPEKRE